MERLCSAAVGPKQSDRGDLTEVLDSFQRLVPALVLVNERVAKKHDLLAVEMQILHLIALQEHPLTPSAIAGLSEVPPSSVTRILDRLAARGFIKRAPDPGDHRKVCIERNDEAIAAVKNEFSDFATAMEKLTAGFDAASQQAIAKFMRGLLRIL